MTGRWIMVLVTLLFVRNGYAQSATGYQVMKCHSGAGPLLRFCLNGELPEKYGVCHEAIVLRLVAIPELLKNQPLVGSPEHIEALHELKSQAHRVVVNSKCDACRRSYAHSVYGKADRQARSIERKARKQKTYLSSNG